MVPLGNVSDGFVEEQVSDRIEDDGTLVSSREELRESGGQVASVRTSQNSHSLFV